MYIPPLIETYVPNISELSSVSENVLGINRHIEELVRDLAGKKRRIVVISGLSGVGKDTLADIMMEKIPALTRVKTSTTRARRPEESLDSDPYNRVSFKEFWEMVRSGDVLEYVEYAGNLYCTSYKYINEVFESGQVPLIKLDSVGARTFMSMWRNQENIFKEVSLIYFFVVADDIQDLRDRLIKRRTAPKIIDERINQDEEDLKLIGEAQYIVINKTDMQEQVAGEMVEIFEKVTA